MRKLLLGVFALGWCVVVFLVTFWLTFPSDALVDRVRWEAPQRLGKEYAVDLTSVSPWWVGLSASDVKLFHTPQGWRSEEPGETTLVGLARDVRVRVSPLSLLRRSPYISGAVTLAEGTIDYAVGASTNKKGDVGLSELTLSADKLPLADLMMLAPAGTELTAMGAVDLDIELEGGESGMADGNGHIRIGGANIVLSDLVLPEIGPLGMDVPISELVLVAEVRDGKATVQRGIVDSELIKVEIKGDITLRDPIDRSSVDLEFVITQLGPQLQAFEMLMSPAKQSDGNYHYAMRGMLSRLSASSFQPAGKVSSRTADRSGGARERDVPRATPRVPQEIDRTETDEEREKRRQEIRDRLDARRAEREGRTVPEPEHADDEEILDDEPPLEEDEEFFDDPPLEEDDFEEFE